jgi:hypothetical protein
MKATTYRPTRRDFLQSLGAAAVSLPAVTLAEDKQPKKTHILTLSFDDGFRKSSIRTAEIYEKHGVKSTPQECSSPSNVAAVVIEDIVKWCTEPTQAKQ